MSSRSISNIAPTIRELVEAWGRPPRAVLEDWTEQLRQQLVALERRAAQRDCDPPCVAAALTLDTVCVDHHNRINVLDLDLLHRSLADEFASPADDPDAASDPAFAAPLHPDYQSAIHQFVQQIDACFDPSALSAATVGDGFGDGSVGSRSAAPTVRAAEIPSSDTRRRRMGHRVGKRQIWGAGAAIAFLATAFVLVTLNRDERYEAAETSSSAGADVSIGDAGDVDADFAQETLELESFEQTSPPPTQVSVEDRSSDLLDQFANLDAGPLFSSETPGSTDRLPDGNARSTPANEPSASTDQAARSNRFDGPYPRAGGKDRLAEASAAKAAETKGDKTLDLQATVEPADDRRAPIVGTPAVDAVRLPPLDEHEPVRLHPEPAENALLEFLTPASDGGSTQSSPFPLRLVAESEPGSDVVAAWQVEVAKSDAPNTVGRIFSDSSGTHIHWAPEIQERHATSLRNGRLRLHFTEAEPRSLFLRAPQEAASVGFHFAQQKHEIAWRLEAPLHLPTSRLHIDFELPETVEYAWIEPPDAQPPTKLVAIAQFTSVDSESVALQIHFEVQTTSRLVCRLRYAARTDAAFPWQWVTLPEVTEAADRVAMQHDSVLARLRQIESLDGRRGNREYRDMMRRRREALQQQADQLIMIAERLGHLMQLMHGMQNEGQIGWRLITEWPDRPQTIFATHPTLRSDEIRHDETSPTG